MRWFWVHGTLTQLNWTDLQQVDPVARRVHWSRASASRRNWDGWCSLSSLAVRCEQSLKSAWSDVSVDVRRSAVGSRGNWRPPPPTARPGDDESCSVAVAAALTVRPTILRVRERQCEFVADWGGLISGRSRQQVAPNQTTTAHGNHILSQTDLKQVNASAPSLCIEFTLTMYNSFSVQPTHKCSS